MEAQLFVLLWKASCGDGFGCKKSGQARAGIFKFQTLPVLSKAGCSMGACHGAPHGKGGFRLSLRAFDPVLDLKTLVHEEFGRRVNC